MLVPAPENLKRVWFKPERGSPVSVRIRTKTHNPSTYGDDEDDDDGGDDGDDDGDDDDSDEDDCRRPPGCDIFNPWHCTCDSGLRDPWGDQAQTRGATTTFGF